MITFHVEQLKGAMDDIRPLLALHWTELALWTEDEFDPNWDLYIDNPLIRLYTVRDERELIGYSIWVVCQDRFAKSTITAQEDAIYLMPQYRGTNVALRLVKWCENQLQTEGVHTVFHHMRAGDEFGRLLESIGHKLVEQVYARRLR